MTGSGRDAASIGLLVLRLVSGGMLVYGHGWGKLMHAGERAASFANPIGLGPVASFWLVVFAEVPCAILVMAGLLTRLATVPLIVFMCVAGFIHHAQDPFPRRELPFLYGAAFVTLFAAGPGRYSLDALIAARRAHPPGDART